MSSIHFGGYSTSRKEIHDLIKAWIVITVAFGYIIALSLYASPVFQGESFYTALILALIIAPLTVGLGFLLHELGHKIAAQRFGCYAEFRSFDNFLLLTLAMAFFLQIVFAAPGAVMIAGPVGKRRNGIISLAGPLVNVILAVMFLIGYFAIPSAFIKLIAGYGFYINSMLALFNLIPVWNFDGAKILRWNKVIYGVMVAISISFFVFMAMVQII